MGIVFASMMAVLFIGVLLSTHGTQQEEMDEEVLHYLQKREKWRKTDCFTDIKGRFR